MKKVLPVLFFLAATTSVVAQVEVKQNNSATSTSQKESVSSTEKVKEELPNPRSAATSTQATYLPSAVTPYDVDDKYMGRANSFKQLFKTGELPLDFPVYEKQYGWGVREYNAVVGAYLENNKHLLTDAVLNKINSAKK